MNYAVTRCKKKRQAEGDLGRDGSQEENHDDLVPDFVPFVSEEWVLPLVMRRNTMTWYQTLCQMSGFCLKT